MPKAFDAISKTLTGDDPSPWLGLAGYKPQGRIKVLNVDLSTVTTAADFIGAVFSPVVNGRMQWAAHLEFSSAHQEELIFDVAVRNTLITKTYRVPTRSILVLLEKDAYRPNLTGRFEMFIEGESEPTFSMNYKVIKVWEFSVEELLNLGPRLMPTAVLSHEVKTPNDAISVFQRLDHSLVAQPDLDSEQIRELWVAAEVLVGLKFKQAEDKIWIKSQVREDLKVRNSIIYQDILEEGEALGLAKARPTERARMLLLCGASLLGPPTPRQETILKSINDLDRLDRIAENISKVKNWSKLLAVK